MSSLVRQGFSVLRKAEEIAHARFLAQGLLKFAYGGKECPHHLEDKEVHEEYLGAAIWTSGATT